MEKICKFLRYFFFGVDIVPEEPIEDPIETRTSYEIAQDYIGITESEDGDLINEWWQYLGRPDYDYKIEWCSLFVSVCEIASGSLKYEDVPQPFEVARSWKNAKPDNYKFVDFGEMEIGDIIVTSRGDSSWQGHVGYYAGEEKEGYFLCLGGNKSNSVKIGNISKDRVVSVLRHINLK